MTIRRERAKDHISPIESAEVTLSIGIPMGVGCLKTVGKKDCRFYPKKKGERKDFTFLRDRNKNVASNQSIRQKGIPHWRQYEGMG